MDATETVESTPEAPEALLPPMDDELIALLDAPIEADVDDAPLQPGVVCEATIASFEGDRILLTLPGDVAAVCTLEDARVPGASGSWSPGDTVRVALESVDDDGTWTVSLGRGLLLERYDAMQKLADEGAQIEGTIRYVVRGGFAVEVDGLRAFLPGRESGIRFEQAFDTAGTKMTFNVARFDRRRGELVVSRKALMEAERRQRMDELAKLADTEETLTGTVVSLRPFGAFVDVGGVDGLLHVSEIALHHVQHPSEVLQTGDQIEVRVGSVDIERGRISLSRRDLLAGAVADQISDYEVGQRVTGAVKRLVEFGAFVELEPGVEGLVHVSELSWTTRVSHPSEVLAEGQEVEVVVLSVDPSTRRVSLSLRATEDNPWSTFETDHPVGSVVSGEITRVEDYGVFVRIAEGIEGLVHVSDLTWEGRPDTPADAGDFAVGNAQDVRILSFDRERQRVGLGIKQLAGDPWDEAGDRVTEGTIFEAEVVRMDERAAWLTVVPGLEGRIHISELSVDRVDSVRSALRIGQTVQVMTIQADRARRRLDLSIKAITLKEQADMPRSFEDDDAGMSPMALALKKSGRVDSDDDEAEAEAPAEAAADEANEAAEAEAPAEAATEAAADEAVEAADEAAADDATEAVAEEAPEAAADEATEDAADDAEKQDA